MRWSRSLAPAALLLLASVLAYGACIEPSRPIIRDVHIRGGRLASALSGRRAAVIGDLHLGPAPDSAAEESLRLLSRARPDLILLVGDIVEWGGGPEAYDQALSYLSRLEAPLGVYSVLGDADRTSSRLSCLLCHDPGSGAPSTRHRVTFLRNSSRRIDVPGDPLRVVGLDPGFPATAGGKLEALLAGDTPTILLSHSSKIYGDLDASLDVLTVSGDTHGGQVRLPRWFWRLSRLKPDPGHMHGYFSEGAKALYVTRGVGTSHVRFRLGVPPEVALLHFSGEGR